ncbi:F0F1 ATP synthase subunit B [Portibacter marinus]|uniref:F0F1 ATP synthase subunit B n=1 Tax=Portibacter marinus TaxID=2898660 RepID=UPI001F246D13|nr:F0F1 ATP synthase subunit B [Portibacter marinus]
MLYLVDFSVIKPDLGLIFWTTLIFLLFWFLIGKLAFKPIGEALKKRETDIQDALDEAAKARAEMENLNLENERLLAEARAERTKMLKEASDTKTEIINEAKDKAREEAKKMIENAKVEIENQKNAAIVEVKNKVGAMAIEIAEKVLKKELSSDNAQTGYVNQLVDDIKLN